jgi:hypothetical protein
LTSSRNKTGICFIAVHFKVDRARRLSLSRSIRVRLARSLCTGDHA